MKSSKIIIIIAVIAIISVIVYILYKKRKAAFTTNTQAKDKPSQGANTQNINTTQVNDSDFPWNNLTYGPNVLKVQQMLNTLGARLAEDGKFGPKTSAALKQYVEIDTIKSAFNLAQISELLMLKIQKKPLG